MLTRRKVLYNLISSIDEAIPLKIQKSMFIFNLLYPKYQSYCFFPNKKGCYSINLHEDYHILENQGYLTHDEETKVYKVVPDEIGIFSLPSDMIQGIKKNRRYC